MGSLDGSPLQSSRFHLAEGEIIVKLVSYNIRFGLGLDQKIDLERIANTVKDADIIALQEVERVWVDQEQIGSDHKPVWLELDF